ncbi:hypothetical protein INS49_002452 [Diaporthe citri]|uniref:uncharacterized protein n=1 Tax=Diaporthe citri TaxID=83186 RepID=UPI001C80FBE7|nr:uncharacterized protein INS49_002452 [Diaporthe citri]KAG6368250.1 hypothetical protein INS49_002452 [Diaporthe citri]
MAHQQIIQHLRSNVSPSIRANITLHSSDSRHHTEIGWLSSYQSFTRPSAYLPFGSLKALGEDRVQPLSGFPAHHHENFEIFTLVLSGELTHRDSMLAAADAEEEGDRSTRFYRIRRKDIQFTTAGTGTDHSEMNEHASETVHLLQIWVVPWKTGRQATAQQEREAVPVKDGTIPIHADSVVASGIIDPQHKFSWVIGGNATKTEARKVYVHLPMAKNGQGRVKIDVNGQGHSELNEGDGAFVEGTVLGDTFNVESIGSAAAEVIVLDGASKDR